MLCTAPAQPRVTLARALALWPPCAEAQAGRELSPGLVWLDLADNWRLQPQQAHPCRDPLAPRFPTPQPPTPHPHPTPPTHSPTPHPTPRNPPYPNTRTCTPHTPRRRLPGGAVQRVCVRGSPAGAPREARAGCTAGAGRLCQRGGGGGGRPPAAGGGAGAGGLGGGGQVTACQRGVAGLTQLGRAQHVFDFM